LNFTIWIKIKKNNEEFFILRELSKYIEENNKLDFNKFYQENYAIFETPYDKNESILNIKNTEILGYINFKKWNSYIKNKVLERKINLNPISHIFFIEGGKYSVYNNDLTKIDNFFFHRRKGEIGIFTQNIKKLWKANFIIYPSKIIDNCFLERVINNINYIFPEAIIDSKWWFIKKTETINNKILEDLANQLIITKNFPIKEIKQKYIAKKDFEISKYSLNQKLENYILEKWWWEEISDEEPIPIEKVYINYNSKENQAILYILESISKRLNTNVFQKIIEKYKKEWVKSRKLEIPQKIYQHPVFLELIKVYNQTMKCISSKAYKIENIRENIDIWYDNIKSFTYIYEIYCFLQFKTFLEQIGVNFIERLEDKLYNKKTRNIISYDKNHKKWFLEWFLDSQNTKIYFLDKIYSNNMRNHTFWQKDNDYKFLWEQFKKINWKDGLSPDITLEIWNQLIICDVKFSSFRDYKSQLDFPNPDYFIETLHKYKRISTNGKINTNPIIIFYPWHISKENINKFEDMQNIIMRFYNMFIFPIYDNWDKLDKLLQKRFLEIFLNSSETNKNKKTIDFKNK